MRKLGAATISLSIAIGMTVTARADNEGYNWQAYDTVQRASPGGWMSYRHDAENNACRQKKAYPANVIIIKKVKSTASWDTAITVEPNYRC